MKKIINILWLFLIFLHSANAQAPYRKIYDALSGFSSNPYSITETSDSDFIMISNYGPTDNTKYNILLNKIDHNGNPIWARELGLSSSFLEPMLVVDMKEHGHLVVTHGDVRSVWVDSTLFIQVDTSGNLVSINAIANFQPDIWAYNVSDSSILMKMDYGSDVQLVNYNMHGYISWSKILNDPISPYFYYNTIEAIYDGSFVLTGRTGNGLAMILLDSTGDVVLNKEFMPIDTLVYLYPLSLIRIGSNRLLFSYMLTKNQHNEFGFLLLDSLGNQLINRVYYSPFVNGFGNTCARNSEFVSELMVRINTTRYVAAALILDSSLNIVSFTSLTDTTFNDGISQVLCTRKNELLFTTYSYDPPSIYSIQKSDSLANFTCINYPFTVTEDSVLLNFSSYCFSTSSFNAAFGPNVTNIFINPVTVTAIDYCGTFLNTNKIEQMHLSISPNPLISSYLNLTFSTSQSANLRLALQDLTGRILYQSELTTIPGTNKKEIPIGDLAKGIYIVTLSGEEGSESVKVSKE